MSAQNITNIEYRIDGFAKEGDGTLISITSTSSDVDITPEINISGLTEGLHTISIRALNSNGIWSLPVQRSFYVNNPSSTKVKDVFYRIYNDGYTGTWEQAVIEPHKNNVDSVIAISTSSLDINESYSFEFYAVNTLDIRGFSAFMDNVILMPTGIEESNISELSFNIYPNPAKEYLIIESLSNINQDYSLKILNLNGQVLLSRYIINQNQTINLTGYAKGVYLLLIQTKTNTIRKQIIVD
jgi:hypothetical protein